MSNDGGVDLVSSMKSAWSQFDLASISRLEPMYHPDVLFTEPAGTLRGRNAVFSQFRDTCANLNQCEFIFDDDLETRGDGQSLLVWTMQFSHRKLRGGEQITSSGCTLLRYDKQITFHRDWFDLGETVYEHIPLLGAAIRAIKARMHA